MTKAKSIMAALLALVMTGAVMAQDLGMMIFNHQIAPGMTFANVQASWGNPYRVDRSVSAGLVMEYWWYRDGTLVVFVNGRVDSITQ